MGINGQIKLTALVGVVGVTKMPMSEMEGHMAITHYRMRKFLLGLIKKKQAIKAELANEDIDPKREMDLKAAHYQLDQMIQRIRFEGILP